MTARTESSCHGQRESEADVCWLVITLLSFLFRFLLKHH